MIKLFVGCSDGDALARAMLEFTVTQFSMHDIEIAWLTDPWARWMVPELCEFEGKAIYMDSNTLVMDDISKLWNTEFQKGRIVVAKSHRNFDVSLWDCAAAKPYCRPIVELASHPNWRNLMNSMVRPVQKFDHDADWNVVDGGDYIRITDESIKAIHYTSPTATPDIELLLGYTIEQLQTHS